jgi:hypothetical protein
MTVETKFANVFMAFSASGHIRVIKFRDDIEGKAKTSVGTRTGQGVSPPQPPLGSI